MANAEVPDTNVGDTISRQAAIDAFKKELTVGESKGTYVTICCAVGYEGAKQILERLPSAEPTYEDVIEYCHKRGLSLVENEFLHRLPSAEPRKGEWIAVHDPVFADTYYCSECKEEPLATDTGWVLSNFCPNCGADMRG